MKNKHYAISLLTLLSPNVLAAAITEGGEKQPINRDDVRSRS